MATYTGRELQEKTKGGITAPEIKMVPDVTLKLWIPVEEVFYKRTHYQLKTLTKYTNAKHNVIDCLNQMPGEKGKGCPIEDEVEKYWAMFKEADTKKDTIERKRILGIINRLVAEHVNMNVIRIADDNPEYKFETIQFSMSKFNDILKINKKYG